VPAKGRLPKSSRNNCYLLATFMLQRRRRCHNSSQMKIDDLPAVLIPLGFTETEALVYGELLRHPDQTGYGLSKTIRKGQPVTYAALSSLASKGAVMASMAPAKAYRAIPPLELIDGLRHTFDEKCALANAKLTQSIAAPPTDQLFDLKTRAQVFERARAMIREARSTVLYQMWPVPAEELRQDLASAAARPDVEVAGLVLRAADALPDVRTVIPTRADYMRSVWREEVFVLITDARQILIGRLGEDDQVRSIWTDSPFFSVVLHNAITSDILLHEKMGPDWTGPNRDLFGKLPPGFEDVTAGR